jgi:hypothetical protein
MYLDMDLHRLWRLDLQGMFANHLPNGRLFCPACGIDTNVNRDGPSDTIFKVLNQDTID